MKLLSSRIQNVSPSATIAVTSRARQMLDEGRDVISFGAGEPDFDTPEFIKQAAFEALEAGDTKYTPRSGNKLKQAIADKLAAENNLNIEPDCIVVTFGGKHAIYDTCQVLLDPGDKVLIPAPYWVSYPEMVRLAGGEPVIIDASAENGFKISPQDILDAADGAKVLILNSPCNPTGAAYSPRELADIAEAVEKTDLIVFSDEIYEKLIYGDTRFVSFASLGEKLPERTVTFNGLSKSFAMTGWRIGWAAGPAEIIKGVNRLMSHETTKPAGFIQAGALAAYTDERAADAIETMRAEFAVRGRHMSERLNAIEGVSCAKPEGAFYCFPNVSAHYGKTLGGAEIKDSMSLARAVLEQIEVALVPGVAFGQDRCVRLSFATDMESIDKGLDRLEKFLSG